MKHPLTIAVSCLAFSVLLLLPAKGGDLDGLKVSGTLTNMIGTFSTYGPVHVGDTFEIDLCALPKLSIALDRPNFNPEHESKPYIPLHGPLTLDKVEKFSPEIGPPLIHLRTSPDDAGDKLLVQINTSGLEAGKPVTIYFYQEVFGRILCMAEAKGVLK